MTHWASLYIGRPWILGESDCWHTFCAIQREQYGREVVDVDVDITDASSVVRSFTRRDEHGWAEVDGPPEDGDAVLMGTGSHPRHIGVYIGVDGGGVLHAVEHSGVIYTPLERLAASGWTRTWVYRPQKPPPTGEG